MRKHTEVVFDLEKIENERYKNECDICYEKKLWIRIHECNYYICRKCVYILCIEQINKINYHFFNYLYKWDKNRIICPYCRKLLEIFNLWKKYKIMSFFKYTMKWLINWMNILESYEDIKCLYNI